MKTPHKMYCPTRHRSLKAGKKGMAVTALLFLLIFFTAIPSNLHAVPADEIDWGWSTPPTFPNEAYGPRTDVNPDLIGDNHLFDVWVPDGDGPYPVMIYAHGGGFKSGSKVKAIGGRPKLAEDNIVFISINYTLGQGAAVGVQDGIDAIKYIKANHEKYKIDPEKIFLSGNSAGGIMMNYIIYDLKMPGILGTWQSAYHKSQFADLSIDNLREVGIPIAISMSKLYPADPGHSPLAAVTLLEKNVAAGNSGMWIGSTDDTVEQVWINGKWIKNVNDGINTGESYPDVAEWIHSLSSHGVTQAELSGLDAVMLRAIEQGKIEGCSFLVAHKGKIVYKKAHGAFTTEEQVPLASVSKPFAASVIMALVEQGKLKLDDPVEKYLPEFKGKRVKGSQSPARPMTIRHLLSHTAGFWGNKGVSREKIGLIRDFSQTLEESVLGAAQYDLLREPGTKWIYSGIGYCVAGRVAEAALGDQSFEKVAQDALFRPLGMNRTTYLPTSARPFILVGGSLNSTLDDMAVFGQMHLNDGVYNGTQILSNASVTEQRRLQIPEERFRAPGLGWHRGFPDEDGLADLLFISGATGPNFRVDRRRQTVTVFLVRSTLRNVVNIFDDLNQHVEQMFPVPKSLPDGPSQAKRRASDGEASAPTGEVAPKWKTAGLQQANTMDGGEAAIPKSKKIKVFILSGQSGMAGFGRSHELPDALRKGNDRVLML